VCYKKGGHLAITDANLALGRILPETFPKIFGPHEVRWEQDKGICKGRLHGIRDIWIRVRGTFKGHQRMTLQQQQGTELGNRAGLVG
jgi:hypothetical protein